MLSLASHHLLQRRRFLSDLATGTGGIALTALLARDGLLAAPTFRPEAPLAVRQPHFAPRARRVLHVFCCGAVSQLETFDYKPELVKRDGKAPPDDFPKVAFQGPTGNLMKPLWEFRPRGQSGKMVSELLPHLAQLADDMCFVHSMSSKTPTHGPGECFMSTGFVAEGYPSVGAWIGYALGCESDNLPAYVAIPDPRGIPQQGPSNWTNGFLPAAFQGTPFNAAAPIANLARPATVTPDADRATRDLLRLLNEEHLKQHPEDTELTARMASYELAARMQLSAPEVSDLSRETKATRALYGADDKNAHLAGFARNCILARRLLERGVRFVSLYNGAYNVGDGVLNWDGHRVLREDYERHAPILDKPLAGLLKDLKQRGLLEDTLIVWTSEFGRMPVLQRHGQAAGGRDHNPHGFTVWLAGAGVRKGHSHGATDELGYRAAESPQTVHDLHATLLHLLGLDHEKLTFYHNGIQRRLTDVHGHVIKEVLA